MHILCLCVTGFYVTLIQDYTYYNICLIYSCLEYGKLTNETYWVQNLTFTKQNL